MADDDSGQGNGNSGREHPVDHVIKELEELEMYGQPLDGAQGSPDSSLPERSIDRLPTLDEKLDEELRILQAEAMCSETGQEEEPLTSLIPGAAEDYLEMVGQKLKTPENTYEADRASHDPELFYIHVMAAMKEADEGRLDAAVVTLHALIDGAGQEGIVPYRKTYATARQMLEMHKLKNTAANIKQAGLALILDCTDKGARIHEDERPAFMARYSDKSARRIDFALRHPKAADKLGSIDETVSRIVAGIGRGLAKVYAPLAKAAQAVFYAVAEPTGVRKFIESEEKRGLEWDRGEKVMVQFLAADFAAAIYFAGGMAVYEQYGTIAGFAPLWLWTLSALYELGHRVDVKMERNALGKPDAA
ncbi:hypothetical protein JW898_03515 [Candidatus Woesearchaeota archaeon]|nr:hypothetical protein [Candidatus Woesearchaeota archaeon]